MPTRLLMTCTEPGSDSKKAAGGTVAVDGGRMAVLMNPQSGSLQPAMLVGTAGGLETTPPVTVLLAPVLVTTPEPVEFVMVPVLVPTKAPTVLLAPVLVTAPEAVDSVMVPALAPTKPPPTLAAPTVTLPLACELVMVPLTEFEATSPPAMLPSPACTLPVATDKRIAPELLPTKPPA
jgi:hypothetical protein